MRRAFTLLEVLVVLALIGILAAIMFPVIGRAREQARRTTCTTQLHQVGLAIALYRQDYTGLPAHLSNICPQYLSNPAVLLCPSDAKRGQHAGTLLLEGNLLLPTGVSYQYFPRWEKALELGWYEPWPHPGNGKWDDLTPAVGCAWHWASTFNSNLSTNVSGSRGWQIYLTLGGSVRKVRVEENLASFTPDRYR